MAVLLTGTQPAAAGPVRHPTFIASLKSGYATALLTQDASDSYTLTAARTLTPGRSTIRLGAPATNVDSNTRMVAWPEQSEPMFDGETCATWADRAGRRTQMGAALRIVQDGFRVRALTVSQNIWFNPFVFNIHTWDTSRPGRAFVPIAQFDLQDTFFADDPPLPWRFCARAIGPVIEFKLWSLGDAEPAWGDTRWGRSAIVPPEFLAPGHFGWYAGHLGPGDHADYASLSVWSYQSPPAHLLRDIELPVG